MSAAQTQTPVSESHGVLLTRFLEKEWDALYTTRGAWCRKVGVADSTVYRWSQGVEPDIRNMRLVADGLGRKLIDILYAAGYVDDTEVRVRAVTPPRSRASMTDVVNTDSALTKDGKEMMLKLYSILTDTPVARRRRGGSVRMAGSV